VTLAETVAVFTTTVLGLAPIIAYLIDWAGLGLQPWPAIGGAIVVAGVVTALQQRSADSHTSDLLAWLGVVILVSVTFLRMSWPALVPPGRGPDLTHHLLLVDYIQQNGHLVHDRSLDGSMGEMAHYTPAAHLLAVIAGALFGVEGLRAFFSVAAIGAALTAGFVFLIARRIGLSRPYSIAAVIMLFLPAPYFLGAFTHDSFLAQTVSTLFAVAMWWALARWEDHPGTTDAVVIAVFLAATFLAWPIWIGPPLLVFLALVMKAKISPQLRIRHLAIVIVPLLTMVLLHSWGRWGWMSIVRTSGAVLHPSLDSIGWLLPLLATIGVIVAAGDRRARVTIVLLVVIALQSLTLYVAAAAQGAETPYMALKMAYLAIYPLAILAAYALKWGVVIGELRVPKTKTPHSPLPTPHFSEAMGWLFAATLLVVAVRPALTTPRPVPVIDLDLNAAGQWLRAHAGATCADYLVVDAETAYWLHLAVLGNPRSGERMRELDRYEPRAAMAPWITAAGRRYAIADLRLLPDEVRSRVQIVTEFGHAAVIALPDATIKGCDQRR
jgi:hypothetical protein